MIIPFVSVMRSIVIRAGWAGVFVAQFFLLVSPGKAAPAGRVTGTFEGIECEYSPEREELVRLIAHRLALYNQEILTKQTARKSVPEPV